ncbi:MAG: AMP-binding protein [Pseudomonadota bacterium]
MSQFPMNGDPRRIGVTTPMPGVVYPPPAELQRYVEAGALGFDTVPEAFVRAWRTHASRDALVGPEGNLTYAELDVLTDRAAAAFLHLGLAPLDRVMFQVANCNESLICLFACWKAGLIPVCTLAAHREQEIGYLAAHAEAKLHLVHGAVKFDDVAFAEKMQREVPSLTHIVQLRGPARGKALALPDLIAAEDPAAARALLASLPRDPFQVCVFQLSGGTTGVPKIIPRFHNDYLYNMRAVAAWNSFTADDTLFIPMPFMHNLNMVCCFGPMLLEGARVAVAPNIEEATITDIMARHRPTWIILGPLLAKLEAARAAGRIDFASARTIVSMGGAAPLRKLTGAPVMHIFGMTEGVIMYTRPQDPQQVQDICVGRPVSPFDQVRIVKPGTEQDVVRGETGECIFRGPYTIHGYYDAAERNRDAFTSDGWYRSGDLMEEIEVDGQSYYIFKGRTKDVIDRGGEKINCEEVEWGCNAHPSVAASAVVGMPDRIYGERACAFLVLRPDMPAPDVASLGAFLKTYGMASFKWPERVEIVKEFPMTISGKLSKPALKQMIAERIAAESGGPAAQ